jgi:hypothetical protein
MYLPSGTVGDYFCSINHETLCNLFFSDFEQCLCDFFIHSKLFFDD